MMSNISLAFFLLVFLVFLYFVVDYMKRYFEPMLKDRTHQFDIIFIFVGFGCIMWFGYLMVQDDPTRRAIIFTNWYTTMLVLTIIPIMAFLIIFIIDTLKYLFPKKKEVEHYKEHND